MTMESLSRSILTVPRRGTSLMEMMVVISMMTVALPAATIALAGITKAVHKQRREDEAARIAERLVQQFRSDVHQAQKPVDVTTGKLVCELPNEVEVTYTLVSDASDTSVVDRIARLGSRVLRRKSFQLAPGQQGSFLSGRTGERSLVELRVESQSKKGVWRTIAIAPVAKELP